MHQPRALHAGLRAGREGERDVTYWPHALRARVELRARCRVREITTNEEGMASGVVYYDAQGVERFQPAEVVILAANGIGTPRLLLNSTSARFPAGLANSSGLVGKNLMLHPWPMVFGYVDEEVDGDRGPQTVMWSKEFYETDPSRGFVRGYTLQFTRGTGPANEAITSMAAGRFPWGKDHHRVFRSLHYRLLLIGVACENLPEEHNRVTLDPVLKDSHGIPAPKIDYTISENTRRMMEHGIARGSEILATAGGEKHIRLPHRAEQPWSPPWHRAHGLGPSPFRSE
jgi:choline dehydrogenase-like flavoprotein